MKTLIFAFIFAICAFSAVWAQPRPIEKPTPVAAAAAAIKPAPTSFAAKYEGGMIGFTRREMGTLKFDDENERMAFFGADGKEVFGVPYKSLLAIFPTEKSVTSTAGNVIRAIPIMGSGLGGLIKEKRRYLVMQYDDPDVDAKGLANFKLETKELLDSVLKTLGEKAEMKQRGDAYYRPRPVKVDDTQ